MTALDQSARMVEIARERLPEATVVQGDAVPLPFPGASFDRVVTGHFYGHLLPGEQERFLAEARVAPQIVVVDTARRPDRPAETWEERILDDGSAHAVYKRYFTTAELGGELGGGEVLFDGRWFVIVAG